MESFRTYDVAIKFRSRDDRLRAVEVVRYYMEESLRMLRRPEVWEAAIEVVRSGGKRPSDLRNRVREIPGHSKNLHESTYYLALQAASGYVWRLKFSSKLVEFLDGRTAMEFFVFGRSPLLARRLAAYFGVGFEFAYAQVKAAGRRIEEVDLPDELPQRSFEDLAGVSTTLLDTEKGESPRLGAEVERLSRRSGVLQEVWTTLQGVPRSDRWGKLKKLCRNNGISFSAARVALMIFLHDQPIPEVTPESITPAPEFREAPLHLLMGSKYVIRRPGNAAKIQALLEENGEFPLDFRGVTGMVQVPQRLIENGRYRLTRVRLVDNLVKVQVVLDRKSTDMKIPSLPVPRVEVIGLDVNRIGEHMLSFSTGVGLPPKLLKICDRYWKLGDEVKRLTRAYERKGHKRVKRHLEQVYTRRKNLRKEIHSMAVQHVVSVVLNSGAHTLVVEKLQLSTRGKRGALAKAVASMSADLLERVKKQLSGRVEVVQVDVRQPNFSEHHRCGGMLKRSASSWDFPPCSRCDKAINSHENAAKQLVAYYRSTTSPSLAGD